MKYDFIFYEWYHYFLPVKGNHKGLLEDIELLFKAARESDFKGVDADQHETLEKSRGRVEKRLYYSAAWPLLKTQER